jgi:hypothetical protein
MMLGRPVIRLLALLLLALLLPQQACSGGDPPPPRHPPRRDRSITTLDRLLTSPAPRSGGSTDPGPCMARAAAQAPCPGERTAQTLKVRVALDPRYLTRWGKERLGKTIACVNRLYAPTGLRFMFSSVAAWDPGEQRHDLRTLLRRLQREHPPDDQSLVLGITVWDKRRVYSQAGGEIGLSQRGHCVVPSWPRVENDCVILAHELGHLVGARHVPGKEWIMGWAARPFHLPASDPMARVVATYRFHPRNVEVIRLHRAGGGYTPRGFRLAQGCRERVRAVDRCWRLR